MVDRMRRYLLSLLTTTFLYGSFSINAVYAQSVPSLNPEGNSVFSADNIEFNQELQIVTASGNVEIVQSGRILKADKVIYNVSQDSVVANGNIALLEPTGEVIFADKIELANELKTGTIKDIRVLFTDNSKLAAQSAVRVDENKIVMNKAVYSTCTICKEKTDADPLWQIKSDKVIHDKTKRTVTYENAVLEFFGVPVAYTPYFSHPDPTVKRESGFLAPSVFNSSNLGYGLIAPYYYVIDDTKDVTFTPMITTKEGVQIATEYRQAFENGEMELDGSLTYVDQRNSNNITTGSKEFQGHLRGVGEFDITKDWKWGFDVFATNNDTYLQKYNISNDDTLTSTAYVEGIRGRNYTKLSTYSFQGLQAGDTSGTTPFVPGWLEYSYVGEPDKYGARFNADIDALTLVRTSGQDTHRVSASGGWHLPFTSDSGQVFELNAALRGDTYYTQDQLQDPFDPTSPTSDNFSGRAIPSISLKWNYPFVRQSGNTRQTIEPIVEAVWSEAFGSNNLPNEDSLSFEFDDTNLFGSNRYAGLDRVEEGARLNYGVNFGFYGSEGGYSALMVGQSVYKSNRTGFAAGSGLENQLSDYVARLEIRPNDLFTYTHRVRVGQDDFSFARNEIDFSFGDDDNFLKIGYLDLAEVQAATGLQALHEVRTEGRVKLAEFWNAYGSYRRNLKSNGGSIAGLLGVEYLDECFGFALEVKRDFTRNQNLPPSTTVGFKIRLLPFN
jgi:LPS-assembly protein